MSSLSEASKVTKVQIRTKLIRYDETRLGRVREEYQELQASLVTNSRVPGQCGLQSETLSPKKIKNKK